MVGKECLRGCDSLCGPVLAERREANREKGYTGFMKEVTAELMGRTKQVGGGGGTRQLGKLMLMQTF